MGRRSSTFGKRTKTKRSNDVQEDYFIRLPDEVIVYILSKLPLVKAAETSMLSHRWRKLWTYSIGTELILHPRSSLCYLYDVKSYMQRSFVRWVNKVLELHTLPTLDEFNIRFSLGLYYSSSIDSWLEFAFRKGVKRLILDLAWFGVHDARADANDYAFPGVQKLSSFCPGLATSYPNQRVGGSSVFKLEVLCLKSVKIDQEIIDFLLFSCPFLERLCLEEVTNLVNLKVAGTALSLKCLEIINCRFNKKIEISAGNLMSFGYKGRKITLELNNLPHLSKLSIGGGYSSHLVKRFSRHFSYISKLKTLKLEMSCAMVRNSLFYPLEFPEMSMLEQLEVTMYMKGGECLLWPTVIIKTAPLLQRFAVKLNCKSTEYIKPAEGTIELRQRIKRVTDHIHQCLKVVEIIGFCGLYSDIELMKHLMSIAQSVEKVVIDVSSDEVYYYAADMRYAREQATRLAQGLSPNTIFQVISTDHWDYVKAKSKLR